VKPSPLLFSCCIASSSGSKPRFSEAFQALKPRLMWAMASCESALPLLLSLLRCVLTCAIRSTQGM
jgi:hypothetical protein